MNDCLMIHREDILLQHGDYPVPKQETAGTVLLTIPHKTVKRRFEGMHKILCQTV